MMSTGRVYMYDYNRDTIKCNFVNVIEDNLVLALHTVIT